MGDEVVVGGSGSVAKANPGQAGASMAGLLAARVLAEHFGRVTVVERDRFPEGVGDRRGVPQDPHAHGLSVRGGVALEGVFPGIKPGHESRDTGVARGWRRTRP